MKLTTIALATAVVGKAATINMDWPMWASNCG
jgi:hypothetical protein